MTIEKLQKIIEDNNIPKDAVLESDSGWECGPTDMNGIYYSESKNTLVFTQECSKYEHSYHGKGDWKALVDEVK